MNVVYRMSFTLAVMHSVILLCLFCRNEFSKVMNESCGAFKALLIIGVFIGSLFIPNQFFEGFTVVTKIVSVIFLLFQMVMVIDLCYLWNESWVKKYDEGDTQYAYLLIFFTLVLYIGILVSTILMYIWFKGCGSAPLVITVNLIFVIIAGALPFTRVNPNGSIFTSGTVGAYTTYLTYAGLSNMIGCSSFQPTSVGPIVFVITGIVLVVISLLYITFGDSEQSSGNLKVAPNTDIAKGVLENKKEAETKYEEDLEDEQKKKEKKEKEGESKNPPLVQNQQQDEQPQQSGKLSDYTRSNGYIYFHLIMLASAMYMSMLLTKWGTHSATGQSADADDSSESLWFMVSTAWVTSILYIWTIVAPYFCVDRDFS